MFHGTLTALVTPFLPMNGGAPLDSESAPIDFESLESLIEWQLQSGIQGFVACGTTGETATLSFAEWKSVVKFVIEKVKGRGIVIAGTGTNCTRESLERTRVSQALGVEVAPLWSGPRRGANDKRE